MKTVLTGHFGGKVITKSDNEEENPTVALFTKFAVHENLSFDF